MAKNGGAASIDGPDPDTLSQPAPGSGAPQPAHDGREYWRREAHHFKKRAIEAERLAGELDAKLLAASLVIVGLKKQIAAAQAGGST